jgi:acyl-CoA thioester hydrolase
MKPDPSHFSFWHPVDVRFKDIDVGGHAHHSLALVYFEEARSAFWQTVVGRGSLEEVDFILAEASVRYHRRVLYPLRIHVGVRVPRVGKKHFVMEYLARDPAGEVLLSGETTLIMYDYRTGSTKPVPLTVREALDSFGISETGGGGTE